MTADSASTAGMAAMKASGPETKARSITWGKSNSEMMSESLNFERRRGETCEEEHEEGDDGTENERAEEDWLDNC